MNVLNTLYKIKQSYEARIQPLTEQQIILVLNQSSLRKNQRYLSSPCSTPTKYEPSSQIVSKLRKIQQFGLTRSKDFQFIFGQAFTEYTKDTDYILKLGQYQNTLNDVMRDITYHDLKPIAEDVINQYNQQAILNCIEIVKQSRNKLSNIKSMIFQKNQSIQKLLLKKQNIDRYLKQLKKVQTKITPIYKTLYSDYQIQIISQHVRQQHSHLKQYKFYNTLSTFLNNRIYQFQKNLRKVFIDNLIRLEQSQIKQMLLFLQSLKLFKKQSVPQLLIYCFKQALSIEVQSIVKQYKSQNEQNIEQILVRIQPQYCIKCICQFLISSQKVLNNYQIIKEIFQLQNNHSQIQSYIINNLILFYRSFKKVLCSPISSQIFLFSVLNHYCINILKNQDIWMVIAREAAQQIKSKLIEHKNGIIQDLNVQLWNAVQFEYTTRLDTYQTILTLQLTYHGKIEWMITRNSLNKKYSSLIPNSHILYSFFKFSKTFEKVCLNIPYFHPLQSNFLLSSILQLLNHFIIQILKIFIDYPPIASSLYEKQRQWYNYKCIFNILKNHQPKKQIRNIDSEDQINLLCESIQFIDDLVRGHQWVLLYKHEYLNQQNIQRLRDLENAITQLSQFASHCFIKSKLKSVDLQAIGSNEWISGSESAINTLVNSFDIDFLTNKQSKQQFSREFQYLFIDKICSQNFKSNDFQKMMEQFSILKRKLESKGYKSAKQVQRFLVVCISKQQDDILKLLYQKKLIYTQRTIEFLYNSIKKKNEEKLGFWNILTVICEGEPTQS